MVGVVLASRILGRASQSPRVVHNGTYDNEGLALTSLFYATVLVGHNVIYILLLYLVFMVTRHVVH